MNCPACGGACTASPNGMYARCNACEKLYTTGGGQLRPVVLPAGTDPALFAAGLGFGGAGQQALPPDPMQAMKNSFAEKASNMGVRAKVGGVQIDLNKGGVSVDTAKLQKDVEKRIERKISGWIGGCVFSIFFFGFVALLLIVIFGYVGFSFMTAGNPVNEASEKAAEWDGKTPFVCPPNGNVTLSGVTADLPGTAIKAGGNCTLVLEDMNITGDVAVDAGGNATVTITGGTLKGKKNSIVAGGNANVVVSGATVDGPTKKSGGATISGI